MKDKNYEITKENIFGHEIIGLEVKVIKSSDGQREGIYGRVVDETRNTFTILGTHAEKKAEKEIGKKVVEDKEYIVPKNECVFEFNLGGEKVIVKGNDVLKKPEDRAKEWRK
ncbi:MAG: ribonuclease P protein subunit [Candidatus Diapherotrites archaeon]|nr:ribonuclease P protein subunit [Candidatus Diapherotrites archaeon]